MATGKDVNCLNGWPESGAVLPRTNTGNQQ
jgi:hypothetical protein